MSHVTYSGSKVGTIHLFSYGLSLYIIVIYQLLDLVWVPLVQGRGTLVGHFTLHYSSVGRIGAHYPLKKPPH